MPTARTDTLTAESATERLQTISPFVPLLQTGLWVCLFVGVLVTFRSQVSQLFQAILIRIRAGNGLKLGAFELGPDLKKLQQISPGPDDTGEPRHTAAEDHDAPDWARERDGIYKTNHGIFITHVLFPSKKPDQKYDVFIYLIRHNIPNFSDVDFAEFYLGHMWNDRIFRETAADGMIGFHTSAYAPFLCTCRVHFKDGSTLSLSRYIDFEMERAFRWGDA